MKQKSYKRDKFWKCIMILPWHPICLFILLKFRKTDNRHAGGQRIWLYMDVSDPECQYVSYSPADGDYRIEFRNRDLENLSLITKDRLPTPIIHYQLLEMKILVHLSDLIVSDQVIKKIWFKDPIAIG